MAYQPINYANLPIMQNPALSDFATTFAKAIDASRRPKMRDQEIQSNELANALSQVKLNYAPQMSEADLAQNLAMAQKAKQEQMQLEQEMNQFQMLQEYLRGGVPTSENMRSPQEMKMRESDVNIMNPATGMDENRFSETIKTEPVMDNISSRLDELWYQRPELRPLLMKKFALSQPKTSFSQSPETGQTFGATVHPSGRGELQAYQLGKPPKQRAMETEMGKADAKVYGEAVNQSFHAHEMNGILDTLDKFTDNEEFKNVVGPIRVGISKYLGTEEQKALQGAINTVSGMIIQASAKDMRGPLSDKDLRFLQNIKPGVNDTIGGFKGKLQAMREINRVKDEYATLTSQYINSGMTALEASSKAKKDVRPILENIEKAYNKVDKNYSKYRREFNDENDFRRYYRTLTPKQQKEYLEGLE